MSQNVLGYNRNLGSLRYGTSTASKMLVWKNNVFLFNWSLFIITQWNCTSIGSCSTKKRTNGSAAGCEPMAIQPAIACQNGRGVSSLPHLRFIPRSDWGMQLIARPEMQYSFHISGNRGYDSNRVSSLSIFHSYCVEDVTRTALKYNHVMVWRGTTQHQDSRGSKTQGSQENTPSTGEPKGHLWPGCCPVSWYQRGLTNVGQVNQ